VEILAALLTAACYWLFSFYLLNGNRQRRRETAGPLLLDPPQKRRRRAWRWWFFGLMEIALLAPLLAAISLGIGGFAIIEPLAQTIFLAPMMFSLAWPQTLELRQRGLLFSQGFATSCIPWARVKYGKWSSVSGRLQFQLRFGRHEFDILEEKKEATLAVLRSLVELRDDAGCIVNPEIHAAERAENRESPIPAGLFQFDLWTLMLFMLFASAAMSWYGIRYRRDAAHQAALARLDPFKPQITGGSSYLSVDFSASTVKPGDRDLALLADLVPLNTAL
jgi:hypothetical protein